MSKIQAKHLYSGMPDYWGGDGNRWETNKGCLFSHYDGRSTLRGIIDGAVEDFCAGGDCDSLHADITEKDVRAALLDMLTDYGRAEYHSGAVAECAKEFADVNGYEECRNCGESIGDEHEEGCVLFAEMVEDDGLRECQNAVVEADCTDPDGSDDGADFPFCVFLIETEVCSRCGAWAKHHVDDICEACAERDDQAWYHNRYECVVCGCKWADESECTNDDRCPDCSTSMSPYDSEDVSLDVTPIDPEVRKKVIEAGLRIMYEKIDPSECNYCDDGSVYYGLIQILPKGSL